MIKEAGLRFKGTSLRSILVQLQTLDLAQLEEKLGELTGNTADFFSGDPAVLDFSLMDAALLGNTVFSPESWESLKNLLARSGLYSFAFKGLPENLVVSAKAAGLFLIEQSLTQKESPSSETPPKDKDEKTADSLSLETDARPPPLPDSIWHSATILDKPLRSGQRFYAKDSDLVVLSMVSAGAEVIADGHIHIYAPLRGRALAGATGNEKARIFTTRFAPELVSIAGIYRTFETGISSQLLNQPATVFLEEAQEKTSLMMMPLRIA